MQVSLAVAMEEVKRMTRPYPLRIPEGILQLAELQGDQERTDKATVLRQWLYAAAEEYAFKRLAEGRLTLANGGTARPERIRCAAEGAGTRDPAGSDRRAIPPGHRDGAPTVSPTQRVSDAVSDMTAPRDTSTLLTRIKSRLQVVYGDRMRGVVLYGSEARGIGDSGQ